MGALEAVKCTIEKYGLIPKGTTVIVGFSGGPDSTCLLHCLWKLAQRPEGGWHLHAVHINHQLRGADADADESFAAKFCRDLDIPFRAFHFDVMKIAAEQGLSTEDAGRRVRYGAFEEERARKSAAGERCVIAVAQNADDQAETVLMRLMRGTGINGLGAMEYKREDGIVRPLLNVSRMEIEAYCQQHRLEPRIDLTNLEPDYTRNRIRLELLPYIKERFNPNISETLNRLAETAREDTSFIDNAASEMVESGLKQNGMQRKPGVISFPVDILRQSPPSLRKRAIIQLFGKVGLCRDISAIHLEQAEKLLKRQGGAGTAEFPKGFRLLISYEQAQFLAPARLDEYGESTKGHGGAGAIALEHSPKGGLEHWGYRLEIQYVSPELAGDPRKSPKNMRFLDRLAVESSGLPLMLRTRHAGDFIRPLGSSGSKKLQDYFVDRKVPREEREGILLVCLGSEILWIAGDPKGWNDEDQGPKNRAYGMIGEPYKLRQDSGEAILLRILPKEQTQTLELQGDL